MLRRRSFGNCLAFAEYTSLVLKLTMKLLTVVVEQLTVVVEHCEPVDLLKTKFAKPSTEYRDRADLSMV